MIKLDIERGTMRIILDTGKVHELLCRNVTWCTAGNRCTLFNSENGRTVFTCDCHEVSIRDIETGEWLTFNTGQEWSDAMQNYCVGLEDVNVQSISDHAAKMIADKVGDQWEIKEDGIGAKQIADNAIDSREIAKNTFIPDHYTVEYWAKVREDVDIVDEDTADESTIKVTTKHIDGDITPKTSGVVDPENPPAADIEYAKQDIRNSADRIQVGVDADGNPVYNYIRVWADKASLDDIKGDYLGTKTDAGDILTLAKRQVRESVDIFNEDTTDEKTIKTTAKHIDGEILDGFAPMSADFLTNAKKELRESVDIFNEDATDGSERTIKVTTKHIDGEITTDGPTLAKKDIRESVNKYDTGEVDAEGNPIYDYIHVCVDAMEFNKVDTISIDGEGMPDPADPTKELKPAKKSIREAVDIENEDDETTESTIKVSTKHVLENAIVAESFTDKSITTNAIDEACFVPDQFSGYDQMEKFEDFDDMPAFIRKCVDAVPTNTPGEYNYIKVAVAESVPNDVKHFTTPEEAVALGVTADALDQIREAVDIKYEGTPAVEDCITVWTSKVLTDAINNDSFDNDAIDARVIKDAAITEAKFNDNAISDRVIAANAITVDKIKDGAITNPKIATAAIDASKLATDTITSEKIKNGTITADKIYSNAITADKIAENAITDVKIKDGAITTNKLVDYCITDMKIASNAITTEKLQDGLVTAAKLADYVITDTKLANECITTTKLVDGLITNAKIANDAITAAKIANDAITSLKIADNTITNAKIANGAISDQKIAEKSLTEPKFGDGAISARVLADQFLTEPKFGTGAISNRVLADGAISDAKIADAAITNAKFADAAIDADVLADETITRDKFADAAIDVDVIADETITADKFAVAAITKDVVDQCADIAVASDNGLIDKNFNKSFYDAIKAMVVQALKDEGVGSTWYGTQAEYDALATKNAGTTYYIYE